MTNSKLEKFVHLVGWFSWKQSFSCLVSHWFCIILRVYLV